MVGEQFDQQRMMHASVDDVRETNALLDRVGAGLELGDHALADARAFNPPAQLGGGQAVDQARLVVDVLEQAGRGGQVDDLLRVHRDRDRPRRFVGIDVVQLPLRIGSDGGDYRGKPIVEHAVDQAGRAPR